MGEGVRVLDAVLADVRALVEVESPSSDSPSVRRAAEVLATQLERRLGGSGEIAEDGRLTWAVDASPGLADPSDAPVLVLGHLDTVWPHGTLERIPFEVGDERVTGPGVFDMKAGLVVAVHAMERLAAEGRLPAVRLLVTPDEEVGAVRSRTAVEEEARRCGRVLVPEPCGPGGAVKVARKGMAWGRVVVHGRAAHSGLDPEQGVNAATALGTLLPLIERLSDPRHGTTVVPTLVRGGTTMNTVPAEADAHLDVRFAEAEEAQRVRRDLATLPSPPGTRVETHLDVNRGPLTHEATSPLLPALRAAAEAVGQEIATVAVGGVSDGNIAADAGAWVLDGLGPVGDGAHAEHEHVLLAGLQPRIDLLVELLPRVAGVTERP
jgi:glutamate carboxypeptidase